MTDPQGTIDFFISYRGQQAAWAMWINWVVRTAGYSVEPLPGILLTLQEGS